MHSDDTSSDVDSESNQSTAAIDYDILDRIGQRFRGSARIERMEFRPEYAPNSLIAEYNTEYFPAAINRAYLRIRWYENDDFNIHYSEQYTDETLWECRWDRHPNEHNTRDHFHPLPNATTPGQDEEYPRDWRDTITEVLEELDARIQAFWE
jgi:hypothetical protein